MTSYTLRQIWLSGDQVGPHFRWGKVATLVTSILVGLLILSLVWPEIIRKVLAGLFMFVGAFVVVTYLVFAIPATRYNLLKLLLKWRGWAYNPRSAWSRIYLAIVGLLGGTAPRLWELQPALPSLPVPDLAHTCKLYLSSVEPLLSKEEFETTKKVVAEFQKAGGPGEKLQSMLIERARVTPNWLIEWWERFVYLRGRMPIAVYSNWYGLDRIDVLLKTPVARCANLVSRMLEFKKLIDTKKLEPHRIQGTVPLCMWQYSRIFGTVRVPGIEEDHLEFHSESRHVTVICRDQYFKLEVYKKSGTPLKPTELQSQLQRIHDMAQESTEKNVNIAALTSQNRDVWAKQREELKSMDAKNVETLKCIEESLFVIVFDESEPTTVDEMCHIGMHRNGKPLWFDKNFNLIITKNGRCITNVDHTWADAVTMVTVYDFVFGTESSIDHWVKPSSLPDLPKPQRLQWQLTADMSKQVDVAQKHIDTLAASLELHVLKFQHFGKELVKRAGMSPDAFCQTAIQLAWYRLRGECALTYESGGTVRFLCGRTETVRSLSCDMKKFCELMAQADASLDVDAQEEHHTARFNQLKLATKACVRYMRKATNGDGADRHLLGLKILAAGSGMPLPALFTDKAYQLQFKLSSSQTPAHSTLGGGFAPLAEDGYGMSYVVSHERLWFHISAYKAHPLTDVYKMADSLEKALLDMRDVLLHSPKLSTDLSQRKFRIQRAE